MRAWLMSARGRTAIYSVALAVIALLVGYQVLAEEQAPLWVALVTALLALAPATALGHITPDADE
jgi:hypothetical protein